MLGGPVWTWSHLSQTCMSLTLVQPPVGLAVSGDGAGAEDVAGSALGFALLPSSPSLTTRDSDARGWNCGGGRWAAYGLGAEWQVRSFIYRLSSSIPSYFGCFLLFFPLFSLNLSVSSRMFPYFLSITAAIDNSCQLRPISAFFDPAKVSSTDAEVQCSALNNDYVTSSIDCQLEILFLPGLLLPLQCQHAYPVNPFSCHTLPHFPIVALVSSVNLL